MAWERDLEKCGMCISCELRKAERQMGVVGKYLIGTRVYETRVPLKCYSSSLDLNSKRVKIIHKELEFRKLVFYSNGTRVS